MKPIQLDQGRLALPGYGTPQPVAQIRWLEGQGNYTRIYLSGQKTPLLISRTLKAFEAPLPEFLRARKGALINPAYVEAVSRINAKQMSLTLLDGPLIRVARRRIEEMATKLALAPEKPISDRMQAGLTQGYPYPENLRKAYW
ncbi:LytTR family DNA-binding domain-containing protein [Spirosoma sp.]|uniref:LytTR family DNA-binding domain-containing protein n=1 Tax=Spirosoma sp. TaxID=1899569 RepID=UPI0026056A0F|nr:LytTR family DNA-binding domain-containing protein [Spirosoma sp.]MCX6212822.1 LytTR family DNA-binding domain-containing protein [Spirosoma sp.]